MNSLLMACLCVPIGFPIDEPTTIPPGPLSVIGHPYCPPGQSPGLEGHQLPPGFDMHGPQGHSGLEWLLSQHAGEAKSGCKTSTDKANENDCVCFPFVKLPCVRDVPTCEEASLGRGNRCAAKGCGGDANCPHQLLQTVVYRKPAHFPMPRYTEEGGLIPSEGVLIYEDMRVLLYDGGRYKVCFNVSTPNMPVTLRIQLHLQRDFDLHDADFQEATLTLPPIIILAREEPSTTLFARDRNQGNWQGRITHIEHEGRSDWLAQYAAHRRTNLLKIARSGVARFGSVPD